MKARVLVARNAVHPMLMMVPLGLLSTSVVWDICRLAMDNRTCGIMAFWTIAAVVVGGLLDAIPGFAAWVAIPRNTRARTVGVYHLLNMAAAGLCLVSLGARWTVAGGYASAGMGRMIWGWVAIAVFAVNAWLGGELLETLETSRFVKVRIAARPPPWGEHHISRTTRI